MKRAINWKLLQAISRVLIPLIVCIHCVGAAEPKPILVLDGKEKITSWALSFDNTRIAIGSFGGLANIYDLRTGACVTPCKFDAGRAQWGIGGLVFLQNDSRLLGGCDDEKIRIWLTSSGELEGNGLQPGGNGICNAAATYGSNKVALIDGRQTVYVMDVAKGEKTQIFAPENPDGGYIQTGLALSRDGALMFVASESSPDYTGWVDIWDVDKHVRLHRLRSAGRCVSDISLTSDSKVFLAGWDEGIMRMYRTEGVGMIRDFSIPNYKKDPHIRRCEITSLAISPNGKLVAAGLDGGRILVWNALDGALLHELNPGIRGITRLTFTRDGAKLLGAGERTVVAWMSKELDHNP